MTATVTQLTPSANDKIICKIDGALVHSIQQYLKSNHPDWTIERYKETYPGEPVLSAFAKWSLDQQRNRQSAPVVATPVLQAAFASVTKGMHEVFELGNAKAAFSDSGNPIPVSVFSGHSGESLDYLIEVDSDYVFNIDLLKKVVAAMILNKPCLLWGMHGTGKTTIIEQVAARTRRPAIRVQHTVNMEESHVIGQWVVNRGEMEFQLGPLALAMLNGWVYIADEYDFAMPSVIALYQPVLEGKSLLIKEAPAHLRKITPHPDFRFFATGNTNGCGDETGLYQGTMLQNAAAYSRFGVTEEVTYMDKKIEENILRARTKIPTSVAENFVKFANEVRKAFKEDRIGTTISPRELINAAQLGLAFSNKWIIGLELAFANRLTRVDRKVVQEMLQRMFGGA